MYLAGGEDLQTDEGSGGPIEEQGLTSHRRHGPAGPTQRANSHLETGPNVYLRFSIFHFGLI